MFRKKKFLVAAGIVALLVAVIGVVVVQAATPTPPGTAAGKNPLMARVAAILNIDQAKLESAFAQAEKEQQADALDKYLQKLVTDGKLTQTQADQYKAWWLARPNVPGVGPGMLPGPKIMPGRGAPNMHGPNLNPGGGMMRPGLPPKPPSAPPAVAPATPPKAS